MSEEICGFTKPALVDLSGYDCAYRPIWFDADGNFIDDGSGWINKDTVLEVPANQSVRILARNNNWFTWKEEKVAAFTSAIKIYIEEGGESYVVNNVEPDEPDVQMTEIASPFTFAYNNVSDYNTGTIVSDEDQKLRILSNEIVGFTTTATIDLSAYDATYSALWYDADGNYIGNDNWASTATPIEVPVDKTVRILVRGNNWGAWTTDGVNTFTSAIKVYVEEGGEAYVVETEKNESDDPVIELGKPIENVLYVIGGSTSTGSAGLGVYENAPRMTALARNGVKPISDTNSLCAEEVYFIAIPADATKITVICPDFIPALQYFNYENDAYTRVADPGWTTLGGLEDSFTAGAYSHVAINFKNSSNTTIPADTDTSGFSIMFE